MVIEKVSIVEMFVSLGEVCMTVSLQIVKFIWKSRIPPCYYIGSEYLMVIRVVTESVTWQLSSGFSLDTIDFSNFD